MSTKAGSWASPAALVLLWQLAASVGWLHTQAFPAPTRILTALATGLALGSHPLLIALLHTLGRLVLGFFMAVAGGVALGLLMGRHQDVAAALNPLVALGMPLPAVVTIPVLSLWLGNGDLTIVLTVLFSACLPILKGAQVGARAVGRHPLWAARSAGANEGQVFWRVVLPGSLVHLVPALRVGMGYAWRAVIAAELITLVGAGLGAGIFQARQFLDVPTMYAGVVLIAVCGLAIERWCFFTLEQLTLGRWGVIAR